MEKASSGKQPQYSPVGELESSVPIAARVENDMENAETISSSVIVPHQLEQPWKIRWSLVIITYMVGFLSGIAFSKKYLFLSNPPVPPSPSSAAADDKTNIIPLPTMSPSLSHNPTITNNPTDTYNYWYSSFQTASPVTAPTRHPTISSTTPPIYSLNPANTQISQTPSPSATITDNDNVNKEDDLILVNETSFTDKMCPKQSYKSTQLYDKILLWAHIYTPNNHPPPKPVGPFDDVPPEPINTATVVLDVKNPANYPVVLTLVAYESTNWTIHVVDQSNLAHVIVTGYKAQYVNVAHKHTNDDDDDDDDVRIDIFDTTRNEKMPGTSLWFYPSSFIPGSLKEFRADLEAYVGVPVYLYDFCYSGSSVEYHFDFSV